MGDTLAYVNGTIGLPAIQNYQALNSSTGGLPTIASGAPGQSNLATSSQGNIYGQVGAGINDLLNPTKPANTVLSDLAAQFPGLKFSF